MLPGKLRIHEEEQLVFDNRTAHIAAELRTLEGHRYRARQCSSNRAVAESTIRFAVNRVRPGFRDDVDCARGRQLVGKIEVRLRHLKFGYGTGGDACRSCSHGFIADVHAIHFDPGSPAETSAE